LVTGLKVHIYGTWNSASQKIGLETTKEITAQKANTLAFCVLLNNILSMSNGPLLSLQNMEKAVL